MAPRRPPISRGPAHRKDATVDTKRIPPAGDPFTVETPLDDHDERPHGCNDGWVTIGQIVIDPETGEETEEYALYLCRRCVSEARR